MEFGKSGVRQYANIYDTLKCFLFVVTNLMALLPNKVYADVLNGLQYRVAKMQTKSEIACKVWACNFFRDILEQTQVINKKCTIRKPKIIHFQGAFTDSYDMFLVMT